MGLISYIKNLYYDNRLKKADKMLAEGLSSEAENIYISILDKQPLAAVKLASFYYTLSQSANVENIVSLFAKVIEIESKAGQVYDVKAYNEVLNKFSNEIINKAKENFKASSYVTCSLLLAAINKTRCKTNETSNLCCESDINIVLQKIDKTQFSNRDFIGLIDDLKSLWNKGESISTAKQVLIQFTKKLVDEHRFYVAAMVMGIVHKNKFHKDCLTNISKVVFGEDTEINSKTIKDVVANYGKQLIMRDDISIDDTIELFDKCWNQSHNCQFVLDAVSDDIKISLREAIVAHIISHHNNYLSNAELLQKLLKWIKDKYSNENAIQLYEKIYHAGYDVEDYYVTKVHALVQTLAYDSRCILLSQAQLLYPKSEQILKDKLDCAIWYEKQDNNERAIEIADSIIPNYEEAKVVKAKALCNLANKESDADKMVQYVEKATEVLQSQKTPKQKGTEEVEKNIQQTFLTAAEKYYILGSIDNCYQILHKLAKQGFVKALLSIISHRLYEVQKCSNFIDKKEAIINAISEIGGFDITSIINTTDYCTLWSEKINATIEECKSLDHNITIDKFQNLINEINSVGFDSSYANEKIELVRKNLIERKYILARELERSNQFDRALTAYKEINTLENKRVPTLSALRFILCKLKSQSPEDILQNKTKIYSLLKNAAKAFKSEKEDIAYRFALILLKAGEDQEALSVLSEYLPEEVYLKKACEQGAVIKAQAKLEDFNHKLLEVESKTLSSDDAIYFVNHMLEYAEIIKPILELPRTKLSKYRTKLKNYAIFKLFDEGKYDVAFEKMIKEHSDYLEALTVLRNIALVCLNIAEEKQLTDKNYKNVISVWLTAIYQEKLFVKSLDYTSWDDQYKFTLQNAFGHFDEFDYDDLPDNVNFDDPEENVIVSIREVQRSLLDRFEASISDFQTYHEFFTSQKDAMDALISLNLDNKCTIVSPYLVAQNQDIYNEISNSFKQELDGHYGNWEDVISVGVLYCLQETIYTEYKTAKELFIDLKDAISNLNNVRIFTTSNVDKIKKFNNLYSSLSSFIGSKVSALKSENNTIFKKNFDFYLAVCNSIKDNAISFTFSNYVMHHVVGDVNDKRMKMAEAFNFILSIYLLEPNNTRVKDNLKTLFEMLVREKTIESKQAVSTILSKVSGCNSSFYQELNTEYEAAQIDIELENIFNKLKNNSISKSNALKSIHAMYTTHPNNAVICQLLAQLCVVCIEECIIGDSYGTSDVKRILNSLKTNRSSEFNKHTSVFRDRYQNIWNQVPVDAKILLSGDSSLYSYGQSLNSKGLALKEGLDYLKAFGGVTSRVSGFRF